MAELDQTGQIQKAYLWFNGQPVGVLDNLHTSTRELYYIHTDHLGTPQGFKNETGTPVWSVDYKPFGLAAINEDPDLDGIAIELNLRFPGQYFDKETGLHYNYFRGYDPSTGRYVQADPLGITYDAADPQLMTALAMAGLTRTRSFGAINNLYGYVFQNPIRFIDPFGLYCYVQSDTGTTVCSTAEELGYGEGYSESGNSSAFPASTNNQCVQDCIAREIQQCRTTPTRVRDIRGDAILSSACGVAVVMTCSSSAADCDEDCENYWP